MTPDEARAFCDELQERATQMGERTGEGLHLGRCLSVIRGLATQVEALTPAEAIAPDPDTDVPVILDAALPVPVDPLPPAPRLDE